MCLGIEHGFEVDSVGGPPKIFFGEFLGGVEIWGPGGPGGAPGGRKSGILGGSRGGPRGGQNPGFLPWGNKPDFEIA